jgi:hypothetical protein
MLAKMGFRPSHSRGASSCRKTQRKVSCRRLASSSFLLPLVRSSGFPAPFATSWPWGQNAEWMFDSFSLILSTTSRWNKWSGSKRSRRWQLAVSVTVIPAPGERFSRAAGILRAISESRCMTLVHDNDVVVLADFHVSYPPSFTLTRFSTPPHGNWHTLRSYVDCEATSRRATDPRRDWVSEGSTPTCSSRTRPIFLGKNRRSFGRGRSRAGRASS